MKTSTTVAAVEIMIVDAGIAGTVMPVMNAERSKNND